MIRWILVATFDIDKPVTSLIASASMPSKYERITCRSITAATTNGPEACHSTIDNVAERAAPIMHEYQAAFPEVVIGDIEPIPALTTKSDWQAEYWSWMEAFQAKTGKPIAFLQIDINWRQPNWRQSLRDVTDFAKARHLPAQAIFHSWGKYPRRSITDDAGPGEDQLVEFYTTRH